MHVCYLICEVSEPHIRITTVTFTYFRQQGKLRENIPYLNARNSTIVCRISPKPYWFHCTLAGAVLHRIALWKTCAKSAHKKDQQKLVPTVSLTNKVREEARNSGKGATVPHKLSGTNRKRGCTAFPLDKDTFLAYCAWPIQGNTCPLC